LPDTEPKRIEIAARRADIEQPVAGLSLTSKPRNEADDTAAAGFAGIQLQ
jgi:hypothetical protein